jgi:hypothetical protein
MVWRGGEYATLPNFKTNVATYTCSSYVTIFCNQFSQTQSTGTKLQYTATLIGSSALLMLLQNTDRTETEYGNREAYVHHDISSS